MGKNGKLVLSKQEILERVESNQHFKNVEVFENQICVYNTEDNKHYNFRLLENMSYDDLFEFNGIKVDKEKFYDVLKTLDQNLFVMPKKITFINENENISNDEHIFSCIDSKEMHLVINVSLCKENTDFLLKECEGMFSLNHEENFNEFLIVLLIHGLRRLQLLNPLYKNNNLSEETDFESLNNYSVIEFVTKIKNLDYCAFLTA